MSFSFKNIIKKSTRILSVSLVAVFVASFASASIDSHENLDQQFISEVVLNFDFAWRAHAEGEAKTTDAPAPSSSSSPDTNAALNTVIDFLNIILSLFSFILTPLIMLAGWLLSPDWTYGDIFSMRPMLHDMWITISNLVYIIFAFLLIVMAFKNIFWEAKDAYALKSGLPKLLTGILMVPFTWFIVSGVLSVANIATAAVLRLPAEIAQKSTVKNKLLSDIWIPKKVVINAKKDFGTGTVNEYWVNQSDAKATQERCDKNGKCGIDDADALASSDFSYKANGNVISPNCDLTDNQVKGNDKCINLQELFTNGGYGPFNALIAYGYGIFKIQDYQRIDKKEIANNAITDITTIVNKLVFWALFYAAFWVICIALVAALFMRAIYMWIYAIFSPIFALGYFFWGKMPGGKALESLQINKFIGLAFVPVIVAAGLSFGLLFLSAVQGMGEEKPESNTSTTTWMCKGSDCTLTIGSFSLEMKWLIGEKDAPPGDFKILHPTKSFIGKIILNVLALMLLWMVVKAALASNSITEKITKPIFTFGETLAKSTPIPIPGMGGMSVGAMQQAAQYPQRALDSKINEQLQSSGLQDRMNKAFGVQWQDYLGKRQQLTEAIGPDGKFTSTEDVKRSAEILKQAATTMGTNSEWYTKLANQFAKALSESWQINNAGYAVWSVYKDGKANKDEVARAILATVDGKVNATPNDGKQFNIDYANGKKSGEKEDSAKISSLQPLKEKEVIEASDEQKKKNIHYTITVNGKTLNIWKDSSGNRQFTNIDEDKSDLLGIFKESAKNTAELKSKIDEFFKWVTWWDKLAEAVFEKIKNENDWKIEEKK